MRNRRQYARLFENEGMKHIPAIFKSHLEDILNGTFSAMRWKLSGGVSSEQWTGRRTM